MAATKRRRKTVLASGVFDLLHLGHVRFLEAAKRIGGPGAKLVVIVARDDTVVKRKGRKPIVPENQRRDLLASLKVVDKAILGYEDFSMVDILRQIRPDIIALGYDSHASGLEKEVTEAIRETGIKTRVVRLEHFGIDELDSSSKIKQKIVQDYRR